MTAKQTDPPALDPGDDDPDALAGDPVDPGDGVTLDRAPGARAIIDGREEA